MKKAVIATGGKQYLVSEDEQLLVELVPVSKTVDFEPLLIIDTDKISVGAPFVTGSKVSASVIEQEIKADKVIAIRYKAKKRVDTRRGHRQRHTLIKITKIA